MKPDVLCIMPTGNRRLFVARGIHYFERSRIHALASARLIIVDGGSWPLSQSFVGSHVVTRCAPTVSIGERRNIAIESDDRRSPFVFDLDDDDWYSADWLALAYAKLLDTPAGFVGCSSHSTYDMMRKRAWHAQASTARNLASGATFGYTRELWSVNRFPDKSDGEDHAFLKGAERITGATLGHVDGESHFVYVRHGCNVTGNFAEGAIDVEHTRAVRANMGADCEWYDAVAEIATGALEIRRRDWHLPPVASVGPAQSWRRYR